MSHDLEQPPFYFAPIKPNKTTIMNLIRHSIQCLHQAQSITPSILL